MLRRLYLLFPVVFASLLLAGCQRGDKITHYTVPHVEEEIPKLDDSGPDRMLAAIVPHDNSGWFFKIAGEKDAVETLTEPFKEFLKTVHFDAKTGDPDWELPDGWQRKAGSETRFATLTIPVDKTTLDLAISKLPKPPGDDGAYYLANINRWRGQLKLRDIRPNQMEDLIEKVALPEDQAGVMVNLVGTMGATGMGGPMASKGGMPAGHPPIASGSAKKPAEDKSSDASPKTAPDRMLSAIIFHDDAAWFFKMTGPGDAVADQQAHFEKMISTVHYAASGEPAWTTPDGWKQQVGSGMRFATLIVDADRKLEVAISMLPKPKEMDDQQYLLENINRWRGQMSLDKTTADRLKDDVQAIKTTDGSSGVIVSLRGKAASGGMGGPFSGGAKLGIPANRSGADDGK